jgi:hypothetical protein
MVVVVVEAHAPYLLRCFQPQPEQDHDLTSNAWYVCGSMHLHGTNHPRPPCLFTNGYTYKHGEGGGAIFALRSLSQRVVQYPVW